MKPAVPISSVIPTRNRPEALARALESLAEQSFVPAELIVIDGSDDTASRMVVQRSARLLSPNCVVTWAKADHLGAAIQRNQGVGLATQPVIWFFDDDVLFEKECLARLWDALESNRRLGGVNAMITNQNYYPPGFVSRVVFAFLNGVQKRSYAGRVIGPAVHLLPEDDESLPEIVPVEWLNTGCTLYRREALPEPPFDSVFTGYSMMEDLTLSLRVARRWDLANVRRARIFHDSQPGAHKSDPRALGYMELVNRHYVMTEILQRTRALDYLKLCVWELFQLVSSARSDRLRGPFWRLLYGKWQAAKHIFGSNSKDSAHALAKK
jgi:glycosyltransferase involved in cell wall biosynthesis